VKRYSREEISGFTGVSSMDVLSTPVGLPKSYEDSSNRGVPFGQARSKDLSFPWGFTRSPLDRKEVGSVRNLGDLETSDLLWDPYSVSLLSDEQLAEKMGQTYLSRISYHRRQVPWRTRPLPLGKQIGVLLWLNRHGLNTSKGDERLLFLQAKAPWGALDAGFQFARRLEEDAKLRSDFYHWMVVYNSLPSSKRLRSFREARRIGVGYRDKGTLPSPSVTGRKKADAEAWVHKDQLSEALKVLLDLLPDVSEGEWVDLPELGRALQNGLALEDLRLLLDL
jgi:hypothetical protein